MGWLQRYVLFSKTSNSGFLKDLQSSLIAPVPERFGYYYQQKRVKSQFFKTAQPALSHIKKNLLHLSCDCGVNITFHLLYFSHVGGKMGVFSFLNCSLCQHPPSPRTYLRSLFTWTWNTPENLQLHTFCLNAHTVCSTSPHASHPPAQENVTSSWFPSHRWCWCT